ncbi:MAG: uracil-DNA glycosylase [Desulfovibrionales bacterium]|nr:uracil-DNA glycosylase [Desulfovibrionales bacterium]
MRTFLRLLDNAPAGAVFNPWRHRDPLHDAGPDGPAIRRDQLRAYLGERQKATLILLAEALGYQGGHFSGIAMTSERLLLGHLRHKGLGPEMVFADTPRRTSREDVRPDGFTEPTATIVWGAMHELGIDPRSVILWNAFPWHPYKPNKGLLSNRTPSEDEVLLGRPALLALKSLFPQAEVLAVGQKSAALLAAMGIAAPALRHPANGGAGQFRSQLKKILSHSI